MTLLALANDRLKNRLHNETFKKWGMKLMYKLPLPPYTLTTKLSPKTKYVGIPFDRQLI